MRTTEDERRHSLLKRIQKRLQQWNTVEEPCMELDPLTRRELAQTFRAEIIKLSELLDRDLSHWLDA